MAHHVLCSVVITYVHGCVCPHLVYVSVWLDNFVVCGYTSSLHKPNEFLPAPSMVFNLWHNYGHSFLVLKIETIANGIKCAKSPPSFLWHKWSMIILNVTQDITYWISAFWPKVTFVINFAMFSLLGTCPINISPIILIHAFLPEHWLWICHFMYHWHIVPHKYIMDLR